MTLFPSAGFAFLAAALLLPLPAGAAQQTLNVPPDGFKALFNGRDFTGWRVTPEVQAAWTIEDGSLKSHLGVQDFAATLITKRKYGDFVLLADFRFPTISDSGIWFRGWPADVPTETEGVRFGEQVNLGAGWMGHPMSFHFLPAHIKLREDQRPQVKHISPELGVWHTIKLTVVGRTLTVEVDGRVILDRFEYPPGMLNTAPGVIGLQKHAVTETAGKPSNCPIEFRNVFIREIEPRGLNEPPDGFTALFNGKDLTGWRVSPKARKMWTVEDGLLKSLGAITEWGADLQTEEEYQDFVLMFDFRMPTISDSGIWFRKLQPDVDPFWQQEQFNLRSKGGMGHLESFHYLQRVDPDAGRSLGLREQDLPRVRHIDPEVGVWHTVKLTVIGTAVTAEYDGEVILERYVYPEGVLSVVPAPIRFQKHAMYEDELGKGNPRPIEYRNIFIKEIESAGMNVPPPGFTALFNGKDFTGWRLNAKAREAWSVEDGVLKAPGPIKEYGANLETEKAYGDFVLLVDFRFPTISDSGILFRGVPGIMGGMEQFNLMSFNGLGNLDSLDHLPPEVQLTFRDKARTPFFYCQPPYYELEDPPVRYIDPEVGVWHRIKLSLVGRTLSAKYDGKVLHDAFEYPEGTMAGEPRPIILQKHHPLVMAGKLYEDMPIEFRDVFIREIEPAGAGEEHGLNVPPEGFNALFNGRDLAGWHTPPGVLENWVVEDGVLKSHGLVEHWRASLVTEKHYRDFVLMLEFRMPAISNSGISFRRLTPSIPELGNMEQFDVISRGGMGFLESYHFLPEEVAEREGLRDEERPKVRHIEPEVGVWHKVKLTVRGRSLSAELNGEVLYDSFRYHDWMMSMEPGPIVLQKHAVVRGGPLGAENPCPIEFRSIFIREIGPQEAVALTPPPAPAVPTAPEPAAAAESQWKSSLQTRPAGAYGEWAAAAAGKEAAMVAIALELPDGRTLYVTSLPVTRPDGAPAVLQPPSRIRVRGRMAAANPLYVSVAPHGPEGRFAGRFQVVRPAEEFRDGESFALVIDARDLVLDPSLAGQKDELPADPMGLPVQSIAFHTLWEPAGLEITEVELLAPAGDEGE
jgi:hypothetical protein